MGLGSFNRELTRNSVVLIPIAMHGFVYLFPHRGGDGAPQRLRRDQRCARGRTVSQMSVAAQPVASLGRRDTQPEYGSRRPGS